MLSTWSHSYNETFCLEEGRIIAGTNPNFASVLLCPLIVTTLFIIPHWWQLEQSISRRLLTFPIVIFQFYPQFCMMKILYWGLWTKNGKWVEEKVIMEKNVCSIGKSFSISRCFKMKYVYFYTFRAYP